MLLVVFLFSFKIKITILLCLCTELFEIVVCAEMSRELCLYIYIYIYLSGIYYHNGQVFNNVLKAGRLTAWMQGDLSSLVFNRLCTVVQSSRGLNIFCSAFYLPFYSI